MGARRAVTNKLANQYKRGSRAEKGVILDKLVELTGWNRGHARARLLRVPVRSGWCGRGRPRAPIYSSRVVSALELCWRAARMPAGKRLAPMLPVLVPLLRRDGELDLTDDEAALLVAMSAATIDRRLAGAKVLAGFRGVSHTKPGSLLKTQIPIRTWSEWDDVDSRLRRDRPGRPRGGQLLRRVLLHPDHDRHRHGLDDQPVGGQQVGYPGRRGHRARLSCQFPFPILGIDSDNGSEFINAHLLEWCDARKITFTRSRPGNKNDGCHVEQKNWTHVRELVGYLRFDTEAELEVLNRIWALEQNYTNLLLTQQKLTARTRVGAKVTKRHDSAAEPLSAPVGRRGASPRPSEAALTRARNALRPVRHQARDRPTHHPAPTPGTGQDRTTADGPSTGPSPRAPRRGVLREATNHPWRGV